MRKKKSAGQRARRHAARESRREQEPERRAIAPAQPTHDVVPVPRAVASAAARPETRWDDRGEALRELDTSWNLLATRAGLSRQALIKRRRSVGGRI